jgi:hypothetical protein
MEALQLEQLGFAVVPQVVGDGLLECLCEELGDGRGAAKAGVRNLLSASASVHQLAGEQLAPRLRMFDSLDYFPVRALLFDKSAEGNWNVAWHQDLSIAVAERTERDGFTAWSLKEEVWHVQPPAPILERMLTVRLHLDDCGPENGSLRVLPGSHREGRLDAGAIAKWRATVPAQEIHCRTGDALLMRPLLLHSSSKAKQPSRRRVLHIEFAAEELPGGLDWHAVASPHERHWIGMLSLLRTKDK